MKIVLSDWITGKREASYIQSKEVEEFLKERAAGDHPDPLGMERKIGGFCLTAALYWIKTHAKRSQGHNKEEKWVASYNRLLPSEKRAKMIEIHGHAVRQISDHRAELRQLKVLAAAVKSANAAVSARERLRMMEDWKAGVARMKANAAALTVAVGKSSLIKYYVDVAERFKLNLVDGWKNRRPVRARWVRPSRAS